MYPRGTIASVFHFPEPKVSLEAHRATYRFYLGDCLDILDRLSPESIDVIVTSPPYNLGIRYRTYDDTMPREEYLRWTAEWVRRSATRLTRNGSLFLNVGAKPTDPWTALDVAQAARPYLRLQNTIHWIKSIAIEKALAGTRSGLADDLAVGHYKPINSRRFLHDCHEFVFHLTPGGNTPLDRQAVGVRYQDQSNVARWQSAGGGVRCRGNTWLIPYDTIQSREKDRPPVAFGPSDPLNQRGILTPGDAPPAWKHARQVAGARQRLARRGARPTPPAGCARRSSSGGTVVCVAPVPIVTTFNRPLHC